MLHVISHGKKDITDGYLSEASFCVTPATPASTWQNYVYQAWSSYAPKGEFPAIPTDWQPTDADPNHEIWCICRLCGLQLHADGQNWLIVTANVKKICKGAALKGSPSIQTLLQQLAAPGPLTSPPEFLNGRGAEEPFSLVMRRLLQRWQRRIT